MQSSSASARDRVPPPCASRGTEGGRGNVSSSAMFSFLTNLILPFSPGFSQQPKASFFVHSPPLALVALSPAMRLYCERERPYRLGGAWCLSHEHAWQGELAEGRMHSGDDMKGASDEDDAEDAAWAGSRTRTGITMGSLPAHLGSARLFQYVENIPSSWIGFCTTVARSLREEAHRTRAADVQTLANTGTAATQAQFASYLYMICTHPEGRLAHSLWWVDGRRAHIQHAAERLGPQRVYAAAAVIVCADLTFFSHVDRRHPSATSLSAPHRSVMPSDPPPPLLSYVFLHGAVTLAVEEELQKQWMSHRRRDKVPHHHDPHPTADDQACSSPTHDAPTVGSADESGDLEGGSTMDDIVVEPLLADCTEFEENSAPGRLGPVAATADRRSHFDPAKVFDVCAQLRVLHLRVELSGTMHLAPYRAVQRQPHLDDGEVNTWDVQWIGQLFPDVTQLRVDGPPPQAASLRRGHGRGAFARTRRSLTEPNVGAGGQGYVGVGDRPTSSEAAEACGISGLRAFRHLRSIYLRDTYFSRFPLCTVVDTAFDAAAPAESACVCDCTLPATVEAVSVVGNAVLTDHGLLAPASDTPSHVPLRVLSFVSVRRLARIDAVLASLGASVSHLTHLELSKTSVTSEALRGAELPRRTPALSVLRLTGTHVDDVNFLRGLSQLTVLNLSSSAITAAGLREVPFFPALRELYLMQCWCLVAVEESDTTASTHAVVPGDVAASTVRQDALPLPLARRPATSSLIFSFGLPDADDGEGGAAASGTDGSAGVAPVIQAFPSLSFLDLSNNPLLTDAHVFPPTSFFTERLWACTALEPLDGLPCAADDEPLSARAPFWIFPALRRLSLMHTAVSSVGLLPWMAPQLRSLDVGYTNVGSAGLWTPTLVDRTAPLPPTPLRLTSLTLTGTPITSLCALNLQYANTSAKLSPTRPTVAKSPNAHATPDPAGGEPRCGFTWLPALLHLHLNGTGITPEGLAAGFLGCRGSLRTLSLASTACVAPSLTGAGATAPSATAPAVAEAPPAPPPPDVAVVGDRARLGGMPFSVEPRRAVDGVAQQADGAVLQLLLQAHRSARFVWQPSDPSRALTVALSEVASTLTRVDLARTAVTLDAFFVPRGMSSPLASAAIRFIVDGAKAGLASAQGQADVQSPTASILIALLSRGTCDPASDGVTDVSTAPSVCLWHVLLWRLVLCGQLLEPRHPSLRVTQLNVNDTPLSGLLKEHIVASARVQTNALTVALSPFQLARGPPSHKFPIDEAPLRALYPLWAPRVVEAHTWRRLERLSPRDARGVELAVKEALFGRQCVLS